VGHMRASYGTPPGAASMSRVSGAGGSQAPGASWGRRGVRTIVLTPLVALGLDADVMRGRPSTRQRENQSVPAARATHSWSTPAVLAHGIARGAAPAHVAGHAATRWIIDGSASPSSRSP